METFCGVCNKKIKRRPSHILKNKYCSRKCMGKDREIKYLSKNNPNNKYNINPNLFKTLDENNMYLLGWIASDGSLQRNAINICIHKKDIYILEQIKTIFDINSKIYTKKIDLVGISLNSANIVQDVCELLHIEPKDKSKLVEMPHINDEKLLLAFVRGLFDGDGHISKINNNSNKWPYPVISIASASHKMKESLKKLFNLPCHINDSEISWAGTNAIEILYKLYNNTTLHLSRKYETYLQWVYWQPVFSGRSVGKELSFKWGKVDKLAIPPFKKNICDSGFDLTIIGISHTIGNVIYYKTGIRVMPDYGYYFDVVPRSSLAKTGYILANSIGVIDRNYIGEIMVPLIKLDNNMPDLILPYRAVQMIPRSITHIDPVYIENFDETARNSNGFGSTGV